MPDPLDTLAAALAGRYTVQREIGRGGMATVYLAEDLKHRRSVAIKVLRPELASILGADRFLREIEIAARLQHPHILALYDSGEAAGMLYYVMPFVEGESLRDRIDRERQLPIADAVQVARAVAQALAYAHERGVVHRDIKPENVLMSSSVAVVTDFGVARAVAEAGGTRLTQTGFAIGTPMYMSPEQATGRDEVDGRTDQYALACVVYEMLCGEPPFSGSTPHAVLAKHSLDPVPSLQTLRQTVKPELQAVIHRALAKSPADRYATVAQFAEALGTAGTGTGEVVGVPAVRARRRGRVAVVAGVVAAVIIAGFALVRAVRHSVPTAAGPPRLVVLPFEHLGAPEDRFIADGLTEELRSRVAGISGLSVIASASAVQYQPRSARVRDIARELGVDYVVTGSVRTDRAAAGGGRVRVTPHVIRAAGEEEVWSDSFDAQLAPGELFAVQSSIAERVAGALNVSLLLPERVELQSRPTADPVAYEAYLRGNVYASRRYAEEPARLAVESYGRAVDLDPTFALAYAKLAEAQTMYYYFHDRRRDRVERAREAIDRAVALDSTLLEARVARGYLFWWGQLDADRALAELEAVRHRQPSNSEVLWIIGTVERRNGRWIEAIETHRRAFELDPRSQVYALDLATSHMVLRRFNEAERYVDLALSLAPDWSSAVITKSLVHWVARGDRDLARKVIADARPRVSVLDLIKFCIRRHPQYVIVLGGDIVDSLKAMSSADRLVDPAELFLAKAYVFEHEGVRARAIAHYDSARTVLEPRVRAAPQEADFHSLLGIAYGGLGRRDDAVRETERGVELLPLSREAVGGVVTLTARLRVALMNGERNVALRHTRTLLEAPSVVSKALARVDPFFDPIRDDPAFQALIQGPEHRR